MIRPATPNDAKIFFDARFEKEAVKNMKTKEIPTYEEHLKWFSKQDLSKMYVIGDSIGYVRIDEDNCVSISLLPEHRGKGIGFEAMSEVVKKHKGLKAEIYNFNTNSIELFKKFPEIEMTII